MNLKLFKKRLNAFYTCWKRHNKDYWGNSDVIVINTPPAGSSPADHHPISSYFFFWLLGHNFPDMIVIFTRSDIFFICTKKKYTLLLNLVDPAFDALELKVSIIQKEKGTDGFAKMNEILRSFMTKVPSQTKSEEIVENLLKAGSHGRRQTSEDGDRSKTGPLVIGYILGERPKSALLWNSYKNMKYKGMSVNLGFVKLLGKCGNNSEKSDGKEGLKFVLEELISKLDVGSSDGLESKDENANQPLSLEVKDKGKGLSFCEGDGLEKRLPFEVRDDGCSSEYCLVPHPDEGGGDWELVDANEVEG